MVRLLELFQVRIHFCCNNYSLTGLWKGRVSTDFYFVQSRVLVFEQSTQTDNQEGILCIFTDIYLIKNHGYRSSQDFVFFLLEKKKSQGKCYLCIKHFELPRWKPAYISVMCIYCFFSDEKWQPSAWNGIRNSDNNREERSTNE